MDRYARIEVLEGLVATLNASTPGQWSISPASRNDLPPLLEAPAGEGSFRYFVALLACDGRTPDGERAVVKFMCGRVAPFRPFGASASFTALYTTPHSSDAPPAHLAVITRALGLEAWAPDSRAMLLSALYGQAPGRT